MRSPSSLSPPHTLLYAPGRARASEVASITNECLLSDYLRKKARAENNTALLTHVINARCDDFKARHERTHSHFPRDQRLPSGACSLLDLGLLVLGCWHSQGKYASTLAVNVAATLVCGRFFHCGTFISRPV